MKKVYMIVVYDNANTDGHTLYVFKTFTLAQDQIHQMTKDPTERWKNVTKKRNFDAWCQHVEENTQELWHETTQDYHVSIVRKSVLTKVG
jgi:hypothetical protein